MDRIAVANVGRSQIDLAREASAGRSSATIVGDHESSLRQTVVGLAEGHRMTIENPPEQATILVIAGSMRIASEADETEAGSGDLVVVPSGPHTVLALEDLTLLLTVSKGVYPD